MQNTSLRVNMTEILSCLQMLYQNGQITAVDKNKIILLLKDGLSGDSCKEAVNILKKIKKSCNEEFRDSVYNLIDMIE